MRKNHFLPALGGLLLCVVTLAFSIALQQAGYCTYLNSDMSSELILAKQQHDSGSLIDFDWLYSTEIHTLHMNLLYALAFCFTSSYKIARIIGNTLGFVISMSVLYALLRKLRISSGKALAVTALLPFSASALYASNMTIGGYYIVHLPFAYGLFILWNNASERKNRYRFIPLCTLCFLMGFLSVRYVLCFICPLFISGVFRMFDKKDKKTVFPPVTQASVLGFFFCCAGYIAAEIVTPRLFHSGTGSASSFFFNPLDGSLMLETLTSVATDFLKLLGFRGGVPLFSTAGISNILLLSILILAGMMIYHCRFKVISSAERDLLSLASWGFFVNLLCFIFIQGTYLNRYLILAVFYFVPSLPVVLRAEKSSFLRRFFIFLLAAQLGLSGLTLWQETSAQEKENSERAQDALSAGQWLISEGYHAGYGTFWHIRTLEERTDGKLTFTGVVPVETEEGAACTVSLDFIRWLEPDDRSDLNHVPDKTFLLLTKAEETQLSPWLAFSGAKRIYDNQTFTVYGFESSTGFVNAILLARGKMENGSYKEQTLSLSPGGRFRVPTSWREAGSYTLSFSMSGKPDGSTLQIFKGKNFTCFVDAKLEEGENAFTFVLPEDDKYFMILLQAGDTSIDVQDIQLTEK